jgi:poly(beta-D-mannuronate) lyase
VLATGLATDDDALWQAGHAAFQKGIDDIQDDGSLPLEMARGQRALHYHDYALAPLVMMAELARLRGQDWYASRDHAIDRLARRVIEGSKDPAWFNEHTGVAQLPCRPAAGSSSTACAHPMAACSMPRMHADRSVPHGWAATLR